MKRQIVRVVQCRMSDVRVGDVINRSDDLGGWFVVASVSRLFSGQLQASDSTSLLAVSGSDVDMVCVQFVSDIEVPEQPTVEMPTDEADVAPMEAPEPEPEPVPAPAPSVPAALSGLAG